MTPEVIKFQFEIRYSNLLNFNSVVREILSPFVKLSVGLQIVNQGSLEEQIKMELDNRLFIDVRWDRILAISETNISDFQNESSPISVLFSIVEQLSLTNSFGSIKDCLLFMTYVRIVNNSREEILRDFKLKYVRDNSFKAFTPNDYGVVFENESDGKITTVHIGPFGKKDLVLKSISHYLHKSQEKDDIGYMMDVKIYEKTAKVNFGVFKKMLKSANQYANALNEI